MYAHSNNLKQLCTNLKRLLIDNMLTLSANVAHSPRIDNDKNYRFYFKHYFQLFKLLLITKKPTKFF